MGLGWLGGGEGGCAGRVGCALRFARWGRSVWACGLKDKTLRGFQMGNYERSDQPGWGRRRGGSERQGKRRSPSGAQEGRHYRHEMAKRPHR